MAAETKSDLAKKAEELELTVVRRDGKSGELRVEDYQYAIGVAEGAILPDEEPEPEPVEKTYRVVGQQEVAGHPPGETFDAEFPAWQERALVDGGALEVVSTEQEE